MALEDAAQSSAAEAPPVERSPTPAAPSEPAAAPDEAEDALPEDDLSEAPDAAEEAPVEKHVGAAKAWFFASIILVLLIAVIAGANTDSALVYTVAGFTPTIVCVILFVALLDGNYKDVLFWLTPLGVGLLFLAIGPWLNALLNNQLDVPVLTAINLIVSYLILFVGQVLEYLSLRRSEAVVLRGPEDFSPEKLDQYIHTIEDKCKAINFVIGRVYRESRGGSKSLREKIKIPSEWYNEFNMISAKELKEKKEFALLLLQKIEAQLKLLLMPEKDVFTPEEVKRLSVAHDENGYDRIIDVLAVNDRDPVEDYLLGALEFCRNVSEGLRSI